MKSFLAKVKLYWSKFVAILQKKGFLFSYPLAVLTVIAIATHSILVIVALIIWCVTVVVNAHAE